MIDLIHLAVFFPLIGFLINGILGSKIKNEKIVSTIGCGSIGIAFLIVIGAFFETLSLQPDQRTNIITLFSWLKIANYGYNAVNVSDR